MCKERTIIIDIVIPTGMESTQGSGPQPEPTYHLNIGGQYNTNGRMERGVLRGIASDGDLKNSPASRYVRKSRYWGERPLRPYICPSVGIVNAKAPPTNYVFATLLQANLSSKVWSIFNSPSPQICVFIQVHFGNVHYQGHNTLPTCY